MEKKLTKREKFEMLKAFVADNPMLVEFIDHEIELLDKKKSNGNTKANAKAVAENELVFNALVSVGKAVTVSELIAGTDLSELANESGVVSTQKVSAILKRLKEQGKVVTVTDKKKTLFRVATETETETDSE